MDKKSISRFSLGLGLFVAAAAVLSGCANKGAVKQPVEPQITEAQLRAYCPLVTLRDGTSFYNTYDRGGKDDPTKVIYQAAISDVTRSCDTSDTTLTMKVAAAGRVVPGPMFKAGTITMPIRVVIIQGDSVVYSKLHKYPVKISNGSEATQFIFVDDQISLPKPTSKNIRIYVGYDEGARK
ncbi:hypothetical protein [Bartonella sp. LJL80]